MSVTELLLALILIVALLIGTSNRSHPSQDHTEPASDSDREKTKTDNKPTRIEVEPTSTISQPPADKKQAGPQEQPEHWYDFLFQTEMPNWIIIVGWSIAALIAFFSLGAVHRQANIAEAGVRVAQSATEAAKLALDVERPFLILEGPTLRSSVVRESFGTAEEQPFRSLEIVIDLQNRGKGLAVAESGRIRIFVIDRENRVTKATRHNRDQFQFKPERQVISPEKHITIRTAGKCLVSLELWKNIETQPHYRQLFILGMISVRDIYNRRNRISFCYAYWPGREHPNAPVLVGSTLYIPQGHAKRNRTVRSKSDTLL